MHVDMDCFFASVSLRNRPELQGVPIAVAHSNHSAGHSEISCVNYSARRTGIHAGEWSASAKSKCAATETHNAAIRVLNLRPVVATAPMHAVVAPSAPPSFACRCPDLVVIPYEFDAYQEVSERVYSIFLRHTALVQPLSCDEAYLDVSTCGDAEAEAAQMRREILAETGCTASIGIGPTLLAARMATKKGKPNGMFRVRPEVRQLLLQSTPERAALTRL